MADIVQPAQQELAKAHHGFDEAEHRLDRLLALSLGGAAGLGLERVLHLFDGVVGAASGAGSSKRSRQCG